MAQKIILPELADRAPEPPPRGPIVWAKQNLFATPFSIVLTVVVSLIGIFVIRGLSGFVLADERKWTAITTNARLLMVQAYPPSDLWRIWVSIGIVASLIGLSFAFWGVGAKIEPRKLITSLQGVGGALLVLMILAPLDVGIQIVGVIVGAALVLGGLGLKRAMGDRAKIASIPTIPLVGGLGGLFIGFLWVIQVPVPDPAGSVNDSILEGISTTTLGPWTLLYGATVAMYLLGRVLVRVLEPKLLKPITVAMWVLSFPVITLHLTRGTNFDNIGAADTGGGLEVSGFLLIGVAFAVLGGAVIWFLANPSLGELGRGLAGLLLVVAVASWVISLAIVIRILLLTLALFALASPTFAGGNRRTTTRYVIVWAGTVVVTVYLMLLAVGETTIVTPNQTPFGGFFLTLILATAGISLSFPLGVVLALARTSTMPIFRLLSTTYIEVIRGVPLITWLLVSIVVFPIMFPADVAFVDPVKVILFIAFFSAAYLAENVRGGLQSISKGQNEAADALGMTTLQRTLFIVLPQALRAVIPALVGQVIAIFKDTSLVAVVGLFELLKIGREAIASQSGAGVESFDFRGAQREGLIAVAIIYWIFTFTFSRVSQRMERKLGVG